MAADEKEWAQEAQAGKSKAGGRDATGRFTSAEPAEDEEPSEDAPRAGEDAAEVDKGSAEVKQSGEEKPAQQQPNPKDEQKPAKAAENQATAERSQTRWAKENERKANTWETINQTKAQLEQEREQFRIEREQFEAQQKAQPRTERDATGHTAQEYTAFATGKKSEAARLTQQAYEAEQKGDFDAADRLHEKAGRVAEMAQKAEERATALQGATGPSAVWARLATDLPEALKFQSDINTALRQTIRSNPQLMADPMGPYRAAVLVGRKVLETTQAKLKTSEAEAAKVPALQKQIAELTKQVAELTEQTSLQGDGAPLSREGTDSRSFGDLSIAEMEAQLPRFD